MFRLPARLLDLDTVHQYCSTDLANAWAHGDNVIVELWRDDEDVHRTAIWATRSNTAS